MFPAAHMRVLPPVYCKPVRCALKLAPLISRARQRPIASTGRQGNCHSACRASTECEAAQKRNAVSQPDTHSEAADASQASDQAEVCGPVCLTAPRHKLHSEAADASQASDQAEVCGPAYLHAVKKTRAVSTARTFRYLIFFVIPGNAS